MSVEDVLVDVVLVVTVLSGIVFPLYAFVSLCRESRKRN
jgi:hypothetical protein